MQNIQKALELITNPAVTNQSLTSTWQIFSKFYLTGVIIKSEINR